MHEMSIAMSIVESSVAAVQDQPELVVAAVYVRVGAMANVVPEALRFAWGPATRGTRLDGARIEIEWVPAVASCAACAREVTLPGVIMKCPSCGGPTPDLVQGRELEITNLEVADEAAHA